MKIAIATFTFLPDRNGVANVCLQQARVLVDLGYEVSILTSNNKLADTSGVTDIDNIKLHRFNIKGSGSIISPVKGDINEFVDCVYRESFDVIIVHCWQAWPVKLLLSAELIKSRVIFFSHGTSVNTVYDWKTLIHKFFWFSYRYFFMPKAFLRFSDFVHLSKKTDDDRFLDNKIRPKNINYEVISNCVNHIEYKYKAFGGDSSFSLLVVGGYSRPKNEMFVLKRIIDMNFPCKINFVGYKENAYSKKMHEIYNKYLEKCYVHSLVPQVVVGFNYGLNENDILSLYSSSDLFISASKTECQPLVILQAMAYGVPFLSSAVGCVDELPGGLIYRNQNQFDHILSRLYDDYRSGKSELHKLSYEGYHFAFRELSVEKYQEKIRTLLTRVEA